MTMRVVLSLLGFSLILGMGCDTTTDQAGPPPIDAALNEPFTLAPGQTAVLAAESLSLTFEGVTEDGRCPVDMVCIVAGQATTAVHASQNGSADVTLSLTVPAVADGVPYAGFRVHAEELLPLPVSNVTTRPEDYRLRLLVDQP